MHALKRMRREFHADLHRLGRELRTLKRRHSDCEKVRLREPQKSTARVLVAMHEGEPAAAIEYILSKRKGKELSAACVGELEAGLREWWGGADAATKKSHRVFDAANDKMRNAIKQARRFTVDLNLETWIEEQNVQKGINPTTSNVIRQANAEKHRAGVDIPSAHRASKQWLRRWRLRRGLRLRKCPALEGLTTEQMHSKATLRDGPQL